MARKLLNTRGAVRAIVAALRAAADPGRAERERRYLKSDLRHLGVSVPAIRRAVASFARRQPELERRDVLAVVRALWAEPVHERRMAAVEMLVRYEHHLGPADMRLVERLIREARTWALVDVLATTVAGRLVERFSEAAGELDRWAADDDFWVRRAAMLALLQPLRRGEGDFERFGRYADRMLEEPEFFIRKAIGWVLRETAKERPGLVARWLRPRAGRASGVTVREAVKYLPEDEGAAILRAQRAGSRRGRAGRSTKPPGR